MQFISNKHFIKYATVHKSLERIVSTMQFDIQQFIFILNGWYILSTECNLPSLKWSLICVPVKNYLMPQNNTRRGNGK